MYILQPSGCTKVGGYINFQDTFAWRNLQSYAGLVKSGGAGDPYSATNATTKLIMISNILIIVTSTLLLCHYHIISVVCTLTFTVNYVFDKHAQNITRIFLKHKFSRILTFSA